MSYIWIILPLIAKWGCSHMLYPKEPPRLRLSYDDWRPVRESPVRHPVRYPVYQKPGYSYIPGKKTHQQSEASENIEVFSPAPPSILGTFSLFGHATVNAREHASHIAKKSPRPQLDYPQDNRPKAPYQRPQYYQNYNNQKFHYNDYNDPYYYDSSLLSPPQESNTYLHTTSLAPSKHYYEGQPFQTEVSKKAQQGMQAYRPKPQKGYESFSNYNRNRDYDYYNENPEIIKGTWRNDPPVKPVTEKNPIYDQLSNLRRPFETTQPFQKDKYQSYPAQDSRVKFSEIAQPFRITNKNVGLTTEYQTQPTKDFYPMSTIEIPTETETVKDTYYTEDFKPSKYDPFYNNPQVQVSSYQGLRNKPMSTFLPTPSTDMFPFTELTENPTQVPQNKYNSQEPVPTYTSNFEISEAVTEMVTTFAPERSTKSKNLVKSRRPMRPTVPSSTQSTEEVPVSEIEKEYPNKYQQKRKQNNKYGVRGNLEKNSFNKRYRTTTTSEPQITENIAEYTTVTSDLTELPDDKQTSLGDVEYNEEAQYGNKEEDTKVVKEVSSTTVLPSSTSATTHVPTDIVSRLKSKYGNRPRFSVKDYREKVSRATTAKPEKSKTSEPKYSRVTPATDAAESTTEFKFRKYKPRVGPSRYRTSTTPAPESDATTTERTNTFKPSTNRYRPGTGKYYSRYRTSTIGPKEPDDSPATTTPKLPIVPKGVFSARKRLQPTTATTQETIEDYDDPEPKVISKSKESVKNNENDVIPSVMIKKMDDATTTTISSGEEEDILTPGAEPKDEEADLVADLTSSSTNDFKKTVITFPLNKKRPFHKITLPTDNPILPLEAFFKTQTS